MRKNRTMRVAALLLALTLITSCFVGGTFAKYATTGSATGTATAATWFDTITLGDGTVSATNTYAVDNEMAPGTNGTITFNPTVTGTPEVDWELYLTGTVTAGETASTVADGEGEGEGTTATVTVPASLKFKLNGGAPMSFADLQTTLASRTLLTSGKHDATTTAVNYSDPITIDWVWDFEGNNTVDAVDTAFAGQSITFSLTLTAEQVQSVVTES